MLGDIGRLQEQKKDNENKLLSEMSKSELDAEIAKIARVHEPIIPLKERRPKPKPSKRLLARNKRDARRAKSAQSATRSSAKYDF